MAAGLSHPCFETPAASCPSLPLPLALSEMADTAVWPSRLLEPVGYPCAVFPGPPGGSCEGPWTACVAITVAGSPGGTSHQRWRRAWLPAAADPAPRACGLGSGRMAVGPHRVLSGKGLWCGGSLGSPHLVGLGDCAGAGGAVPNCGSCPGGVRPQKRQCLGGPTSSKPWQRDVHVDVSVMTTWRRKEVFLCTFGLVHILKRRCGWMMIFLFYTASETVLEELFLETFSTIENFLCHPPTVNGFS